MTNRILFFCMAAFIAGSCHTGRQTTTAKAQAVLKDDHSKNDSKGGSDLQKAKASDSVYVGPGTPQNQTNNALNFEFTKPANGIYAPGEAELAAIQKQYKNASMQQLNEGHFQFTKGLCTNCHGPIGIYQYDEPAWKNIIEDMGSRAGMTETQKDAVYKYVLSIKATQPK